LNYLVFLYFRIALSRKNACCKATSRVGCRSCIKVYLYINIFVNIYIKQDFTRASRCREHQRAGIPGHRRNSLLQFRRTVRPWTSPKFAPAISAYRPSLDIAEICSCNFGIPSVPGHKKKSRPVSRVLSWTVIPLGAASPRRSSNLPGNGAGHAIVPLCGLAPSGVCHATRR